MKLEDWLDDLCVRFIVNLPHEELGSVERICFQIEEAQWFYEDFIRPLDPTLPSLPLRNFSLLVFQHCPLFAGFNPEFFQQAFAQFLAYKTRVPVRGAILLNENMDHVILVKGWKKSANWSFPRGKINKDEKDLDCAIREVYEETGYDVKAAGLALEERDMKYISVTIREQDVGLYVFRGVPMDAYFEPRTRKEISKIEWWKLSDLPTFRKNKQHEGNGESLAINANKFYMVAPFLNELKKWISFQRRRDAIEGRHLTPMQPVEEPVTAAEDEPDLVDLHSIQNVPVQPTPSDLPEVTLPPAMPAEASAHLKALLNINPIASLPTQPQHASVAAPINDREKSNALLSLLRSGGKPLSAGSSNRPYTPLNHVAMSPTLPSSPHHHHPVTDYHVFEAPPPPFQSGAAPPRQTRPPFEAPTVESNLTGLGSQRSGVQGAVVPPASSLPQLSNHAKTLLSAFKAQPTSSSVSTFTSAGASAPQAQPSLDQPVSQHQDNLLDLFRQPHTTSRPGAHLNHQIGNPPVELAAQPVASSTTRTTAPQQKDLLLGLFQQSKQAPPQPAATIAQKPSASIQILQRPSNPSAPVEKALQGPSITQSQPEKFETAPRPFHPQILRRQVEAPTADNMASRQDIASPPNPAASTFDRRTSQSDVHKKALLSLFSKTSPSVGPNPGGHISQTPPSVTMSPAPLMSPLDEKHVSSFDHNAVVSPPEKSRMGSTSSFGGIARTTKPSDREFLLQYLGVAKSGN